MDRAPRPRRRAAALLAATVLLVVLAAAGRVMSPAAAAAPRPAVGLQISVDDGRGHRSSAHLTCRGSSAVASGYLHARAAAACRQARRIAAFLASGPAAGRQCTEIYGGPDTARVRGRIGSVAVDRLFARVDGCAIADWASAGDLLPRSRFAP